MKDKIVVEKLNWESGGTLINAVNPAFYSLMSGVIKKITPKAAFVYRIRYKFGDYLIRNGKMQILENKSNSNSDKQLFEFTKDDDNNALVNEFLESVGKTSGHPLSIVTKNYVEIYKEQFSGYTLPSSEKNGYTKTYTFPLNIINTGELFGVWEAVNQMYETLDGNIQGWSGVAGKRCLKTLMPPTQDKYQQGFLNEGFRDIFGIGVDNPLDGFISIANNLLGDESFVDIIVIPTHFYVESDNDNEAIKQLKRCLREYISRIAWQQSVSPKRKLDDYDLMKHFYTKDLMFSIPMAKHLVNIADGNAFILKPIAPEDDFLFQVNQEIFKKFRETSITKRSETIAIDYNTPVYFHYAKLKSGKDWGIELAHSPTINRILPAMKTERLRDAFDTTFIQGHKLKNLLDKYDLDMQVELFYRKESGNKDKRNDIKQFLDGKLLKKLKEIYPDLDKVNSSNLPWYINTLLFIEKK